MALFERLQPHETQEEISINKFLASLNRVMHGEMTLEAFVTLHSLTQEDALEAQEYMQAVGAQITSRAAELVTAGLSESLAGELARAFMFTRVWHILTASKYGMTNEAEIRALLEMDE